MLFAVGFLFETIADVQLARFRRDESRRGTVLDTGLFRWSRHPNYFGETLIAWSFWLAAVDAPEGNATIFARRPHEAYEAGVRGVHAAHLGLLSAPTAPLTVPS